MCSVCFIYSFVGVLVCSCVCLCVCSSMCMCSCVCLWMYDCSCVCICSVVPMCFRVCFCPSLQLCFASWLLLPTRKIVLKFFPCETLRLFVIFFYNWYWKMRKKIETRATSVIQSFSLLGTLHSKTRETWNLLASHIHPSWEFPGCWMISLRLSAQRCSSYVNQILLLQ